MQNTTLNKSFRKCLPISNPLILPQDPLQIHSEDFDFGTPCTYILNIFPIYSQLPKLKFRIHKCTSLSLLFRPNKKLPVFRVTRPYLNLLVKPRIFFRFSRIYIIILCILKGEMHFKMHKVIFFFQKKIIKTKYVCLPYLKFSDLLPETHLFFYLALLRYPSYLTKYVHYANTYEPQSVKTYLNGT